MRKRTLVFLLLTFLLIVGIFATIFAALHYDSQNQNRTIVLQNGVHAWDVYVGGTETTWDLAYDSNNLPISNTDYSATIKFEGHCYTLWRVYTNQIQVSSEITCPSS